MQFFISFSNNIGSISTQSAKTSDCKSLKAFQENQTQFETIQIEINESDLDAQAISKAVAKHLWREFGNTPTDDDGADGNIDEDFLHFKKGDPVYDVWHWFESEFDVSIDKDLMGF